MRNFLCDFSSKGPDISDMLKYRFSYPSEDFIEKAVKEAIAQCDGDYSKGFIDAMYFLIYTLYKYETRCYDRGEKYDMQLICNNFYYESVIHCLSIKNTVSYGRIDDLLTEYINITVPETFKEKRKITTEIIDIIKHKLEEYQGDDYEYNINYVLDCAFNLICDSYRVSIYNSWNMGNSSGISQYNVSEEQNAKSEEDVFMDPYVKAIEEKEKSKVYLSCDLRDLAICIEADNCYRSVLFNLLQLELCKKYNKKQRYTKYLFKSLYDDLSHVKNYLYGRYCDSDIRNVLNSMCDEKTENNNADGRWCYVPFCGIDYVALRANLFTSIKTKKVIEYFCEFIDNEVSIALLKKDIITKCYKNSKFEYTTETLPPYIISELKGTKIELFTELINKWITQVRDGANEKTFAKIISEYTNEQICDVNYSLVENFVKNMFDNKYLLYEVKIEKLFSNIREAIIDINVRKKLNDDEYKLYNEIKQLTPYMVERLYGVNISSLLLDRISKTGRLNKSMTPIYKVMQVQNVIGREIIVELYLKGDWDEYTTGKHITYESKWLYPLVMYHVQRLKQDFIKEYYDDENVFYTELLSAIVGALETNRFRLKFFNFDNKKIKKDDIEDVEDFYRNIWKIYYNGNLEKLFDVDFSVPVSINAIKTIIDDFVYNQQTRKI